MFARCVSLFRGPISSIDAVARFLFLLILLMLPLGATCPQTTQAESINETADAKVWNALPNQGVYYAQVTALAVAGTDLYVGGYFIGTGDGALTDLGNIARYNTVTKSWHALPNQGLSSLVYALAVSGNDLYVGGSFSQSGDGTLTGLNGIARYDMAAQTWHALPNQGLTHPTVGVSVMALAVDGSDLYAGGVFSQSGDGTLTDLGNIVRYDTLAQNWHPLPNRGLSNQVRALAVADGSLYVGGRFTQTGDGTVTDLGLMARYNAGWHALANRGLTGTNGEVNTLAQQTNHLFIGGNFSQSGDGTLTNLGNLARYDMVGEAWQGLANQGMNDRVYALAVDGTDLYVGGYQTQTGDGVLTNLGRIARYDTWANDWTALPNQGLGVEGAGVFRVEALAVDGADLYVGGGFTKNGDWTLEYLGGIARYGASGVPVLDKDLFLPMTIR